jgi:hypothetical protein
MARFTSPLEHVRVAAPCAADWERMAGGERVRFCAECSLNVYNLSGMTRREAEVLLMRTEGRLCVRFFRREDGTILTRQCPVGLRALKARLSRTAAALFSAVVGLLGGLGLHGLFGAAPPRDNYSVMGTMLVDGGSRVRPAPAPPEPVMGEAMPSHNVVVGRMMPIKVRERGPGDSQR